ncbi:MAG TPA: hypothetical protein VKP64_02330 [Mycobacteriales bacterium]|nr:hypothetical protein [Mycobacteriales bacterium]
MHDIDRALFETENYESENYEAEGGDHEGRLDETLELQLAGELLEVTNEAELDRFLGNVLRSAISAGQAFVNSSAGKAVGGILKSAAKQALPQLGRVVGDVVAPGVGGQFGARLGSMAGSALGLELEGLSQEDREFEAARAFVRFADEAARTAVTAPPSVPPAAAAARAATVAAQRQLPGLVPVIAQMSPSALAGVPGRRGHPRSEGGRGAARSIFESEYAEAPLQEWEFAGGGQGESEVDELAQELLTVSSEAELDRFLGNLVKGAGQFFKSGVGKAVGGVLKGVAKTALPMVGSALGTALIPIPGVGTAIGGGLGAMASKLLEAEEAEMLGEDEAEFEAARRYVQFARATVRNARMAPRNAPAKAVARSAAVAAARRYAPALLRSQPGPRTRRGERTPGYRPRPYRGYPVRRWPPLRWQWAADPAWIGDWQPATQDVGADWGWDGVGTSNGGRDVGGDADDYAGAGYDADDSSGFEFE